MNEDFKFMWLESKRHPKSEDVRLKGGPGSGNIGHAGIPGHQGGSAPASRRGSAVTPSQRKEVLRQLKSRVEFLRGKVGIQWEEPIQEPGQGQRIHQLANIDRKSVV